MDENLLGKGGRGYMKLIDLLNVYEDGIVVVDNVSARGSTMAMAEDTRTSL